MQARFEKSIVLFSVMASLVASHVAVASPAAAQAARLQAAVGTAAAQAASTPPAPAVKPGQLEDGTEVARSFAELAGKIDPGDTVYVTREAGERTKARVQGFDADLGTLFLNADDSSFGVTETELRQLELRYGDSLANGAIIGAVAGSGIFVIAGIACAVVDSCGAAGETFAAALLFGGIGAGIGVGIDAAVKTERLVYVAPPASARRLALRPLLSPTRRGAVVVLRF